MVEVYASERRTNNTLRLGTRVPIEIVFEIGPITYPLVERERDSIEAQSICKLQRKGRRIGERRSGLGLGFASRASEREEHGDDECRHDPEVDDAASHFGWFLQNLWCREEREKTREGRKEVMLVADWLL